MYETLSWLILRCIYISSDDLESILISTLVLNLRRRSKLYVNKVLKEKIDLPKLGRLNLLGWLSLSIILLNVQLTHLLYL